MLSCMFLTLNDECRRLGNDLDIRYDEYQNNDDPIAIPTIPPVEAHTVGNIY